MDSTARLASTSAKHTWRSSASGSPSTPVGGAVSMDIRPAYPIDRALTSFALFKLPVVCVTGSRQCPVDGALGIFLVLDRMSGSHYSVERKSCTHSDNPYALRTKSSCIRVLRRAS